MAVILLLSIGTFFQANARPAFARKEKRECIYCHLNPSGGARGFRGIFYKLHRHSFKGFDEATECRKAGVKLNAMGELSKPTRPYPANGGRST